MISYCLNFHFCSFQSQCDELSDNTTYLKIATDKLLNGILDFSKNNLDEHFISQEIVKEALTEMNQKVEILSATMENGVSMTTWTSPKLVENKCSRTSRLSKRVLR